MKLFKAKILRQVAVPYWVLCFILTHLPPSRALPEVAGTDKLLHFSGYSLLGFLLYSFLPLKTLPVLMIYSLFDESTQPYFGRDFEWLDLLADNLGGLLGITLGWWSVTLKKIFPDE
jgi:VanZ family protein